ncbi:hypothetical protein BDZ45DRAFT_207642 [Acephala macrosclerotiorum]|nr:hypothetical protein BDZ45DRAFT_207642 [Acephala macrosclerotiorum]
MELLMLAAEPEDRMKSTITSTAVSGVSSGDKEIIVPASKVGNRARRDTGRERIIEKNYEDYPQGWPRIAAFLNTSSTLAVWRRFGTAHNRVLLHLQATITRLEQQLDELDKADAEDPARLYRLRRNEWREGWDTAQKDILEEMHRKLVEYDELLLKDSQLRSLTPAPVREYMKVFDWIYGVKPLDIGQYDFIYHRGDFVCSAKREKNAFDDFIKSCVSRWPNSRFQRFLRDGKQVHGTHDKQVQFFSSAKLALFAKFLTICVAITILLIPIFLLSLVEMSKVVTLIVVLIFVLTFATLMSLLTAAGPESIFVGTCTYSAVLVVFLGNVQGATAPGGGS